VGIEATMKKTIYTSIIVVLAINSANAADTLFYNRKNLGNIFKGSLSYYVASRVCGNRSTISMARSTLIRVQNYIKFKNLISAEQLYYEANPDDLIRRGEVSYRRQKHVSCSQVGKIVKDMDKMTKKFP